MVAQSPVINTVAIHKNTCMELLKLQIHLRDVILTRRYFTIRRSMKRGIQATTKSPRSNVKDTILTTQGSGFNQPEAI